MEVAAEALALLLAAGNLGKAFRMLKIILGLMVALPTLEADVQGVVNEVKDAPNGTAMLRNVVSALKKLAADIEAALG